MDYERQHTKITIGRFPDTKFVERRGIRGKDSTDTDPLPHEWVVEITKGCLKVLSRLDKLADFVELIKVNSWVSRTGVGTTHLKVKIVLVHPGAEINHLASKFEFTARVEDIDCPCDGCDNIFTLPIGQRLADSVTPQVLDAIRKRAEEYRAVSDAYAPFLPAA